MSTLQQGTLVIFMAADPITRDSQWHMVPVDKVPDWIKDDPDVLANLVNGEMAKQADGLTWWRAERIDRAGETQQ